MNNKGGFLINKVNFLSGRIFNKLMKEHKNLDINHAQGKILFVISKHTELSINDLCKELAVSKSTLTSMLDRLEAKGYILKKTSKEDKRITLISNTKKADDSIYIFNDVITKMNAKFYNGFKEEDIKIFEKYLEKIYLNLEKID
ncbi:MarR family winged helix-turn-helix transcriptional regulator [Paraclostridium sordellii]|uniref:MarR family winged helix-turn-helix transcriptional regulator n=1 Tax=Paraclostridium sordellii TaxID=1505 RepID=UPI0005E67200|nr:MarR family transcriptional regulator [Paeniclostridium sordellii]CEO20577.1 transcriptional regulator [[Clostridium] sordellii] [Paeniclostridium sordellii]